MYTLTGSPVFLLTVNTSDHTKTLNWGLEFGLFLGRLLLRNSAGRAVRYVTARGNSDVIVFILYISCLVGEHYFIVRGPL